MSFGAGLQSCVGSQASPQGHAPGHDMAIWRYNGGSAEEDPVEVLQDGYGGTVIQTSWIELRMPLHGRQGRFRWSSLKALGKKGKKFNDYWSEWQDLNLRPLRPERSAYF